MIMKLVELAMKGVSMDEKATRFGEQQVEAWKKGEHVGDIEDWDIKKTGKYLSVWNDDELIAYCSLVDDVVDDIWVKATYREQKVLSKMLWFLRSRENQKRLVLADYHSPETQEIVKGGLKQFKKSWWNKETDEVQQFTPKTIKKFYRAPYTDWALVLENDIKAFDNWPHFRGGGFVKENYDWVDWDPDA